MKLKDVEIATYIPNRLCTERDLDWSIQNRQLKQQKSQTWLELCGARIVFTEIQKIRSATARFKQGAVYFRWTMMIFAVMEKEEKKMSMRDYEDIGGCYHKTFDELKKKYTNCE